MLDTTILGWSMNREKHAEAASRARVVQAHGENAAEMRNRAARAMDGAQSTVVLQMTPRLPPQRSIELASVRGPSDRGPDSPR